MLDPPSSAGALKLTVSCPSAVAIDVMLAEPGTVDGLPLEELELGPDPTALTGLITTLYDKPFVRPVMVIGLEVVPASVNVVPPSKEYW